MFILGSWRSEAHQFGFSKLHATMMGILLDSVEYSDVWSLLQCLTVPSPILNQASEPTSFT
jgi:hypothetical protein